MYRKTLRIIISLFVVAHLFFFPSSEQTALSATQSQTQPKKPSRIDSNLDKLYDEWITHQNSGNQDPFTPGDDTLPIVDGEYVIVDAVAAGDIDQLRTMLESEGLRKTSVFGRIISGEFPLEKLNGLFDETALNIMRPAYALTNVGLVDSQGDVAMRTDIAKSLYGLDGSGITIGTLSDSYDCLGGAAGDVTNGDLPSGVNVLDDSQCPGSDEGRGMMQLIADVAPGADQSFHTAFGGIADFANGIIELQTTGSDIIVDDVFYFAEPFFQDGIIAQAADQVYAAGVPYFSSAGNSARDSYESAFRDSGVTNFLFTGGLLHDFDSGSGVDTTQRVTIPSGSTAQISFQWDQPFFSVSGAPGSANDMDIALLNSSGNVVAIGSNGNVGSDPVEILQFTNNTSSSQFDIVIEKYTPAGGPNPGLLKYIAFRGVTINEYNTSSSTIVGHANAAGAEAVGAARYSQTPPFGTTPAALEPFSSGGNTPILFDTVGNSVTILRDKPEIVAPDGTNTTFFGSDSDGDGFPNFFGTSAAAPHAAAAAALMLEANSILSPQMVYDILEFGAVDMGVSGFDLDTGYGLIEADAAIAEALLVTSQFGGVPTGFVTQIGPNSSTSNASPTFEWTALTDATGYQFVIYDADNNVVIANDRYTNEDTGCLTDSSCAITTSLTLLPGNYRWLVRPFNFYGDGSWSIWP